MDRALPILTMTQSAQTCVWMDAGVVAFRLCDRGYACEQCLFDAAMRRDPRAGMADGAESPRGTPALWAFPANRLYTDGHLWVQTIRDGRVRTGIDAYAARLLHPVRQLRQVRPQGTLERGHPWCVLRVDGGQVPLGLPIGGRLCRWNSGLDQTPALLTTEPYGSGWLAEIALAHARGLDGLLDAGKAEELAAHDASQFRRSVAFHLLSSAPGGKPGLDGAFLECTRRIVGPGPFTALAREFLH